jgi:hypothetical protein
MLAGTGQFPNYFSEEAMRRVGKELVRVSRYEGMFIQPCYTYDNICPIFVGQTRRTIHPGLCMEHPRRIIRRTKIVWANVVCAAVSMFIPHVRAGKQGTTPDA